VLSDPQERAWYDSHRDAILRSNDTSGGAEYVYNVRLTTADHILRLVASFNGRIQFTDCATGFFGGLRETFQNLAREEELACAWEGLDAVDYPSFGHKDDSYEDGVKQFYSAWNGFSTRKSFSWKDIYRYSDAPDRRVRRIMEKENKRLREEGVREFNDAVRSLIAFVRKRDPRYKPNSQSEAERQQVLRDAAQAQAARSRAANQSKLAEDQTIPAWAKSEGPQEEVSSSEESEQEHFECVVCNKTFKSENQFQAHEKSKKHIKAVKQLRHEMKKENKYLDLEDDDSSKPMTPEPEDTEYRSLNGHSVAKASSNLSKSEVGEPDSGGHEADEEETSGREVGADPFFTTAKKLNKTPTSAFSDNYSSNDSPGHSDEDYAPREEVTKHMTSTIETELADRLSSSTLDNDSDVGPKQVGRAKQKRAKKAAQKATTGESDSEFKCMACQAGFSSKTRLFNHIKEFGHAQPVMGGTGGKRVKAGK
jgi:DnaJ family protein A protein 5